MTSWAPCYSGEDHERVICNLTSLAAELGHTEIPSPEERLAIWTRSAARYQAHVNLWRLVFAAHQVTQSGIGRGSATSQLPASTTPNDSGDGSCIAGAPSLPATLATVTVTCAQPTSGVGGCAFHVQIPGQRRTYTGCQMFEAARPFRFLLLAALEGIRRVEPGCPIRIVTDSQFLSDEWQRVVAACRSRGGRTRDDRTPSNWDLLTALDREVSRRRIHFEFCLPNRGVLTP